MIPNEMLYIRKIINVSGASSIRKLQNRMFEKTKNHLTKYLPDSGVQESPHQPCVIQNGNYDGEKLVNTCSIDNFITHMSLYMDSILLTLENLYVEMEGKLAHFILPIQLKQLNEIRFWITKN